MPDRGGVVAPRRQQLDQPLQDLEVALAEPVPLLQHPVVVGPVEEVAAVQLGRLAQGGGLLAGRGRSARATAASKAATSSHQGASDRHRSVRGVTSRNRSGSGRA